MRTPRRRRRGAIGPIARPEERGRQEPTDVGDLARTTRTQIEALSRPSVRAFSLIEVLLALALGGLVLTSVAMLMVSLTQIWINKDPGRKFFEKVSGVEVFLQTHLSIGYTPVDEPPLAIKRDPAIANGDPVLTFYMRKSSPFMEYDKEPHRPIECALHCDDREGLILYWRCPWSDKEVLQKYQKFTLAEAHQLDFYNYDIPLDAWKKADLKANDTTEVPEVLEILFKKDKMEKTVHICLKPRVAITREKKPKEDKQSPQPNKKKRAPKRKERK